MKHYAILLLAILFVGFAGTVHVEHVGAATNLPAFPGAMGGGAAALGGRGGVVMEVTNLNASGGGSLSACVQASGPRTCVFRTAGIVPNAGVANNPFLTIACQTAPGEVLIGGPVVSGGLRISTHDVIVRGCMFSPDSVTTPSGPDTGTVAVQITNCAQPAGSSTKFPYGPNSGCYNIILDHVTTRWAGNKSFITTSNFTPGGNNGLGDGPNNGITLQWSMVYEPHEGHPVVYGTATDETCVGTRAGNCLSPLENNIDFHHNFIANGHHRIPENSNGSTRWVNNILFNWGWYANEWLGAEIIDDINNKFVCGNLNQLSGVQKYPIHFTSNSPEMSGAPSAYVAGNIGCGQATPPADQYGSLVNQITGENGDEIGPIPISWIRATPQPASNAFPIIADTATQLDAILLPTVGASQHVDCTGNWVSHRDPQDQRIVDQYRNGTAGGYWPNGVTFTGSPTFPTPLPNWTDTPNTNFTPCVESLHDGIPDQWKVANHLSTTDPNLYKTPSTPGGYTWLEVYSNGSGITPPPTHPVVNCVPASITVNGTSQCTANQQVTWSASVGSITSAGLYTAPNTPTTATITGTNSAGSGSVPVTITAIPPPPNTFTLVCTYNASGAVSCTGQMPQ